mmetsp:Transcript_20407/g.26312  ORF Transcript_20407/g.26312 Transcript_20407/m.26312 type:complete len:306 (+) Transcript_20407:251-1168(+)|eukprot:CAMPEP_0198143394 /NCGR_PEP_ID=MMETSP1443-20131203/7113_1 /TAXON_ID=186043 /ORGANISM="Entomoneis sp., Strain CCMP2396" /LENGTH=305 /DNA_ID=CAMNT_0043806627 /DNA_START=224 /DNA_END=1141 /DNA_ORIENTATION=+
MGDRPRGPLGIDPLQFSAFLFTVLILFVLYLLLPRAVRKQYFGAYPKRHAWSARSRSRRAPRSAFGGTQSSVGEGGSYTGGSSLGTGSIPSHRQLSGVGLGANGGMSRSGTRNDEQIVDFSNQPHQAANQQQHLLDLQQNDEIVISAAMQQLRDPGVLIVAHGSRGKPKTVRLQLTESAITWRTETRKKSKDNKPKMGKLHQVPLSHIMYVDVGKQTTALRRVENASVSEALCFSLLTKEGSLDLEANSPRERDALVSCFSLVLDEVHAQNWRDIYRGPSSDMPSSFDELDGANTGIAEGAVDHK